MQNPLSQDQEHSYSATVSQINVGMARQWVATAQNIAVQEKHPSSVWHLTFLCSWSPLRRQSHPLLSLNHGIIIQLLSFEPREGCNKIATFVCVWHASLIRDIQMTFSSACLHFTLLCFGLAWTRCSCTTSGTQQNSANPAFSREPRVGLSSAEESHANSHEAWVHALFCKCRMRPHRPLQWLRMTDWRRSQQQSWPEEVRCQAYRHRT